MKPPVVDVSKPTYITNYTTNKIDETNISTTLNLILQLMQTHTITNNYTQPALQTVINCGCLTTYTKGPTHLYLENTGAFALSGQVGFEIEITGYPEDTKFLEGNPPYAWNMGWVSVNNDDGMLAEKRITRLAFLWFPENIALANSFQWWMPVGVTLAVTELNRGT